MGVLGPAPCSGALETQMFLGADLDLQTQLGDTAGPLQKRSAHPVSSTPSQGLQLYLGTRKGRKGSYSGSS